MTDPMRKLAKDLAGRWLHPSSESHGMKDIAEALRETREAALEEAATVAQMGCCEDAQCLEDSCIQAGEIRDDIRALKEKHDG